MIDQLRQAIDLAAQQLEDEQRQIARIILDELADRAWEQSPELAAAVAEAYAEVARGDVMDFEDYDQQRRSRRQQGE